MTPHELPLKYPKGRELLGGDLLAQCLKALGVGVAFGLHGGHLDAFLVGCVDIGIELIDTRHETAAVQAAEGYAKVSGRTGCCFRICYPSLGKPVPDLPLGVLSLSAIYRTTGQSDVLWINPQAFCNGIPGLATAFADRSPIFCLTSSPPLRDAETNTLQGFHDQIVLAKPITKFCHCVTNVGEIPRLASLAWRTASTGAPGPVLLDIPIDILFTPVETSSVAWGSLTSPPVSPPGPDLAAIDQVLHLLQTATRPAIIVGTGSLSATHEITTFATSTGTPIFHTPKFSTAIPSHHPFHAGSASALALLPASHQPSPDLILLLGARTGFLLGGRSGSILPTHGCTMVQIDTDGSEIGRSSHIHVGIVSDIKLAVAALNARISTPFRAPEKWIRAALSLKAWRAPHNEAESVLDKGSGHLHPYHAVKKVFQSLPRDAVVCIDGGEASGWALQLLAEAQASLSMVCTGYLGFLGNGWGYSLGAAVARRDVLVVNVQGDGSAGFHVAELDTYAKFGLRVLTVVVNNGVWGMSAAGQEMIFGGVMEARPAAGLRRETRYDVVAEGFGVTGVLVDATREEYAAASPTAERRKSFMELGYRDEERGKKALESVGAAVDEIVHGMGPGLIDLRVSERPFHDVTKAMVGATDDPDVIVVPYYDNLPRPYYKTTKVEHERADSGSGGVSGDGTVDAK